MKTWAVVSVLCVVVAPCRRWRGAPDAASAVQFVEATSPAGLKFVHNSGRAGRNSSLKPWDPAAPSSI
jgi:hypothetical protein